MGSKPDEKDEAEGGGSPKRWRACTVGPHFPRYLDGKLYQAPICVDGVNSIRNAAVHSGRVEFAGASGSERITLLPITLSLTPSGQMTPQVVATLPPVLVEPVVTEKLEVPRIPADAQYQIVAHAPGHFAVTER